MTEPLRARVRDALLQTFYRDWQPHGLTADEQEAALADHVHLRYDYCRTALVPWIEARCPLAGAEVLEIGCGTGCALAAVAPRARRVHGYDVSVPSVDAARRRLEILGIDNAHAHHAPPAEILRETRRRHEGGVDVVLLYAVLEHCDGPTRLDLLRTSWDLLRPGGHLVVGETPNRLYPVDTHTASLEFFHWLPDDLALAYAQRSPRQRFRQELAEAPTPEEARRRMASWGRGVSFHEFELAVGNVRRLTVAPGWRHEDLQLRLLEADEAAVMDALAGFCPGLPVQFLRRDLDVVLRKPRDGDQPPGAPAPAAMEPVLPLELAADPDAPPADPAALLVPRGRTVRIAWDPADARGATLQLWRSGPDGSHPLADAVPAIDGERTWRTGLAPLGFHVVQAWVRQGDGWRATAPSRPVRVLPRLP